MTTKEAFLRMLSIPAVNKLLGQHRSAIGRIKSDIEKHDKWPSIDKMEELLIKAGFTTIQEKLWDIKKKKS
jgi:hypothetical protein